jgi:molybdenum cofactor biosynthesis enzyme
MQAESCVLRGSPCLSLSALKTNTYTVQSPLQPYIATTSQIATTANRNIQNSAKRHKLHKRQNQIRNKRHAFGVFVSAVYISGRTAAHRTRRLTPLCRTLRTATATIVLVAAPADQHQACRQAEQ